MGSTTLKTSLSQSMCRNHKSTLISEMRKVYPSHLNKFFAVNHQTCRSVLIGAQFVSRERKKNNFFKVFVRRSFCFTNVKFPIPKYIYFTMQKLHVSFRGNQHFNRLLLFAWLMQLAIENFEMKANEQQIDFCASKMFRLFFVHTNFFVLLL